MPIQHNLVETLRAALTPAQVSDAIEDRHARSHDTWPVATKWARQGLHPHPADVVVRARSVADVVAVLAVATDTSTPVTPWGLGSSVTGQPLPVRGGIVLDLSELTGAPVVDETNLTVTVPAGARGSDVESHLEGLGFTLGHSPQSLGRSSVGGWLATLATGQFSSRYGGIEDLVVGYTVVLATGEQVRLQASPRAAMGPDLRQVFIGSEGTFGVVVSATLKIFPVAPHRILEAFHLPDVGSGLAAMREQMASGLRPFLVRFYDVDEARHVLSDDTVNHPVLFLGCEGIEAVAAAEHDAARGMVLARGGSSMGSDPVEAWMGRRYDFSTIESILATEGGYAETIEVAHTWSEVEGLHAALRAALEPLVDQVWGHFSHVYTQGSSLYLILSGHVGTDADAEAVLHRVWETAMEVCLQHGAELSHHHGGGLARSPYARASLAGAHTVLQRLKHALDPAGILNPGKLGL